jgi:hypothetical protein
MENIKWAFFLGDHKNTLDIIAIMIKIINNSLAAENTFSQEIRHVALHVYAVGAIFLPHPVFQSCPQPVWYTAGFR